MATAPHTLTAPVPRFAIGDVVYVAAVERSVEQLPCPDCLGTKKWTVKSPAGGEYTTACPRCGDTYSLRNDMPSLKVECWVGKANRRVITGMELHAGRTPEYRSEIGQGSSWIVHEDKAWLTEAEAQAVADAQAADKNVVTAEKPEVLTSRHVASLTLDEGRWDQFKNGVWNSHYHAGALFERVREALDGEDGNEERTTSQIIEDLREASRWDFKYHVENLPFTPLVLAALASDDDAVKAAVDALPEAMKVLMTSAAPVSDEVFA